MSSSSSLSSIPHNSLTCCSKRRRRCEPAPTVYFNLMYQSCSFFQYFFKILYQQTCWYKLKYDFSDFSPIDEEAKDKDVNVLWNYKYTRARQYFKDFFSNREQLEKTDFHLDLLDFIHMKLNQIVGYGRRRNFEDFEWHDDFFAYFVLPECWKLAEKEIGTLAEYMQCCNKNENRKEEDAIYYPYGWDYKYLIKDTMYKCLPKCKYMQVVLATVHRRFEKIINYQMDMNLSPATSSLSLLLPLYAQHPFIIEDD